MGDFPRVLFMGTPDFAAPILRALLEARDIFNVVGLVSQPDRPSGRGRKLKATPTKQVALEFDIPVFQPTKVKTEETRQLLASVEPDVAVVAAYGRILPPQLLTLPRHGCVNVHASLLPRHRGASPIAHAIMAGDPVTGVCLMQMDEGMDTGAVFARAEVPIGAEATTDSLGPLLAEAGAALTLQELPRVLAGELKPVPQPDDGITHAPLLKKSDGWLDFRRPAIELERRIRAFQPWPGASFSLAETRIQVGRAEVVEGAGVAGDVLEASKHGVLVACGERCLRLLEVKPPGKRMMPAAAWVAGRGVAVGDRLAP
ncbi:MAG: methionyl-tRNA formyltransferase [Myxococcota bacterium]